jgi:hypothetical protein
MPGSRTGGCDECQDALLLQRADGLGAAQQLQQAVLYGDVNLPPGVHAETSGVLVGPAGLESWKACSWRPHDALVQVRAGVLRSGAHVVQISEGDELCRGISTVAAACTASERAQPARAPGRPGGGVHQSKGRR